MTSALWAVDSCGGDTIGPNQIKVWMNLALRGKDAHYYRVAFTLIIKGHIATQPQ
jgi:hypothetical protein